MHLSNKQIEVMDTRCDILKNYYSTADSVVMRSHTTKILEMKPPSKVKLNWKAKVKKQNQDLDKYLRKRRLL